MVKNRKFNLFDMGKVTLALATVVAPMFLNSNDAKASPSRLWGAAVKITSSGGGGLQNYMRKYAKMGTTGGARGYTSLVSGGPSRGSSLTPVSATEARMAMLTEIFTETGQSVVNPTRAKGLTSFKSQPGLETEVKKLSSSSGSTMFNGFTREDLMTGINVGRDFRQREDQRFNPTLGADRSTVRMYAETNRDARRNQEHLLRGLPQGDNSTVTSVKASSPTNGGEKISDGARRAKERMLADIQRDQQRADDYRPGGSKMR